jgi:hypothetical protein
MEGGKTKQVLDGVVSAMKTVRKWRGWEEMKNAEQWCFSIMNNDERLVVERENGVSAMKRGETIAGRSCFGNENSEKMAGVGRNEK